MANKEKLTPTKISTTSGNQTPTKSPSIASVRVSRGRKFWTDERKAEFIAMYREGTQLKIIADRFGISLTSAKNQRKVLKLRKRRSGTGTKKFSKEINLRLTEEQWKFARRRSMERGSSLNDYIRSLIQRDTGRAQDPQES